MNREIIKEQFHADIYNDDCGVLIVCIEKDTELITAGDKQKLALLLIDAMKTNSHFSALLNNAVINDMTKDFNINKLYEF